MREVVLPPAAPAMFDSLRAIGYSFEAALADIVDNSVAAKATRIDIQFRTQPSAYLAIIDDGVGIAPDYLLEAMRHGGSGPVITRAVSDLGRFGLGLKTASLSQCRQLTVVSLCDGVLSGACWDLDVVEQRNNWVLGILSPEEAASVPHVSDLSQIGRGTVVLWRHFDKALAGESSGERALGELIDRGRDHLALSFHRYLVGEDGTKPVRIGINNAAVRPVDPFLRNHRATRRLPTEMLSIEGATVTFEPFILPHISKLRPEDMALAGGEDGLRRNQGFYVYRGRRLITSGTWFRLIRQEEMTKLARVLVDIPNSLDHLWALDVKKSAAYPPEAVRASLRRVVERIADTSRHVYRFRGRRTPSGEITHAWNRMVVRGGVSYTVNREHPAVLSVREALDERDFGRLSGLLRTLELSLPTDALYADMASERRVQNDNDAAEVVNMLRDLATRLTEAADDPTAAERILAMLPQIEPFSSYPAATKHVQESLRHVR